MEKEFMVQLKTIKDVSTFTSTASTFKCDIDLVSGRYVVDAKSIMGIYSLNLSEPIKVVIGADASDDEVAAVKEAYKQFIVD